VAAVAAVLGAALAAAASTGKPTGFGVLPGTIGDFPLVADEARARLGLERR
jgi:hypothetical protein